MNEAGTRKHLIPAAGWFIALLLASAAVADPIPPASLVPALTVYVDSLARGHAAIACAPEGSPARDEAAWSEAKAIFVATLWANAYPPDFVRDATERLDAPAQAATPDCADPAIGTDLAEAADGGWPKEVHRVLGALDLAIVEHPVAPERWAKIKDVIGGELSAQAREFTCLAAVEPGVLPVMVHDWNEMIVKLGGTLVGAGIPRPEIVAALGGADANILWRPASADTLPALRKSCMDDRSWSERFASFRDLGLGGGIERMLAGENP